MTGRELLGFLRERKYGVEASVSTGGAPQAAVVGVVVTDALEIFFDTSRGSRKYVNLERDPKVAFVFWHEERTVQIEGIADFPTGDDLRALKQIYFERFPDGRERESWPDIGYVRVRPGWIRVSDFGADPPRIVEGEAGLFS